MCRPGAGGQVIANLQPGQEIVILPGYGYPATQEGRLDIIWQVHKFSALTANGVRLMCADGNGGIVLTSTVHDSFEVSPEAQAILDEVNSTPTDD